MTSTLPLSPTGTDDSDGPGVARSCQPDGASVSNAETDAVKNPLATPARMAAATSGPGRVTCPTMYTVANGPAPMMLSSTTSPGLSDRISLLLRTIGTLCRSV